MHDGRKDALLATSMRQSIQMRQIPCRYRRQAASHSPGPGTKFRVTSILWEAALPAMRPARPIHLLRLLNSHRRQAASHSLGPGTKFRVTSILWEAALPAMRPTRPTPFTQPSPVERPSIMSIRRSEAIFIKLCRAVLFPKLMSGRFQPSHSREASRQSGRYQGRLSRRSGFDQEVYP